MSYDRQRRKRLSLPDLARDNQPLTAIFGSLGFWYDGTLIKVAILAAAKTVSRGVSHQARGACGRYTALKGDGDEV